MADDRLPNQDEEITEERLRGNEEERRKEAKTEEKLGEKAGSLSWLLGLGLSLLPSNHLDLSPRWQHWFLRCPTFSVFEDNFHHRGQSINQF